VSRSGDPAHYRADIAEAAAWGWAPQRYWTDEIGPYVDWFRAGAL
jgi:nucleoside-diphosphate-sugar epimerase